MKKNKVIDSAVQPTAEKGRQEAFIELISNVIVDATLKQVEDLKASDKLKTCL